MPEGQQSWVSLQHVSGKEPGDSLRGSFIFYITYPLPLKSRLGCHSRFLLHP